MCAIVRAKPAIIRDLECQRHATDPATSTAAPHRAGADVVLLNKPYGVLCQFTRATAAPDAADFVDVPDVYPAGRLDADSEGLVVLTADGALQARIADPRHKLAKTYWVQVEGEPLGDALAALARGRRRSRDGVDASRTSHAQSSPRRRCGRAIPPIRVRRAIPTAWLELATRRGPQPPGAADDRCGRPADAAARPRGGRPWTLGTLAPGAMARGARRRRAVISHPPTGARLGAPPLRRAPVPRRRVSPRPRPDDPPPARPPDARPAETRAADLRPRRSIRCAATRCRTRRATVIRKLQDEGFKAFIVGGAVRDLLLGLAPKDFDLATDATPEQVKPLFRRAFIIGRRFRLVHVHVGNEVIEVSTFRAAQTGDDATDEHGRLLSDNVYGTQAEDAARRDFTINALYFDPADETIWDFVGGDDRRPRAPHEADRPAGHPLPRGPGADAARRAPRREARTSRSIRRPPSRYRGSRR